MTYLDKIKAIVRDGTINLDEDSVEKLVYLAYWYGREQATRGVSERYNAHIAAQHERAEKCRYKHMARAIVGAEKYLYSLDYSAEMTVTFGNDKYNLEV